MPASGIVSDLLLAFWLEMELSAQSYQIAFTKKVITNMMKLARGQYFHTRTWAIASEIVQRKNFTASQILSKIEASENQYG